MNGSDFISVVVPTHNHGRFIRDAVESVLAQSCQAHEIIVVDDGSTDDTKEALRLYEDKIHYIFQEKQGPSAARNQGMRSSKGRYISFIDADDIWLPDKLELQMQFLREHADVGLVFGEVMHWSHEQTEAPIQALNPRNGGSLPEGGGIVKDAYRLLLASCYILTSTVVMRRECISCVGQFNESLRVVEDRDLWLRIARKFPIGYVDHVVVRKRAHGRNISLNSQLVAESRIRVLQDFSHDHGSIKEQDIRNVHEQLASLYCQLGTIHLGQHNKQLARRQFLESLKIRVQWTPILFFLYSYLNHSVAMQVKGLYRRYVRR